MADWGSIAMSEWSRGWVRDHGVEVEWGLWNLKVLKVLPILLEYINHLKNLVEYVMTIIMVAIIESLLRVLIESKYDLIFYLKKNPIS